MIQVKLMDLDEERSHQELDFTSELGLEDKLGRYNQLLQKIYDATAHLSDKTQICFSNFHFFNVFDFKSASV